MIVSIYMRKGKDIQKVPGLNTIAPGPVIHRSRNSVQVVRSILLDIWQPLEDSNNLQDQV